MGKLAERYRDAARSGIYRVRDAAIPRLAATEAGAQLLELSAAALADGGWERLRGALATSAANPVVALVEGVPPAEVVRSLQETALAARSAGTPFFAVFLDERGELPFSNLYREKL